MRSATVGLLLALWCVLAIAPAVVIALVVGVDPSDPAPTVLVIWIVGYLAQIGLFLLIMAKTSGGSILGWLIAALVPWSANWAAAVSPWWLVACAAIVVGYSVWLLMSLPRIPVG
jgi:hypothetical protein